MNRFMFPSLIVSIGIVQPLRASETLFLIKDALNPGQLIEQILCPSGSFELSKAQRFLLQLESEVKEQHGIKLDLKLITDEALAIIKASGEFSESEIAMAKDFYARLLEPETKVFNSHSYKKHKHGKKKSQEFVLPDKMALGFVCILSGALLCALPFGITQGIGTGLIGTGIYSVLDGAREGEKPYYIDSETGQRIVSPIDDGRGNFQ